MKYVFSISFIFIYLLGSLQASRELIDFYWNRDDYTQKYCQMLDEGITQCRASCYLDNIIEEKGKKTANAQLNSHEKVKIVEITNGEEKSTNSQSLNQKCIIDYPKDGYHFDFYYSIFHPPKSHS